MIRITRHGTPLAPSVGLTETMTVIHTLAGSRPLAPHRAGASTDAAFQSSKFGKFFFQIRATNPSFFRSSILQTDTHPARPLNGRSLPRPGPRSQNLRTRKPPGGLLINLPRRPRAAATTRRGPLSNQALKLRVGPAGRTPCREEASNMAAGDSDGA